MRSVFVRAGSSIVGLISTACGSPAPPPATVDVASAPPPAPAPPRPASSTPAVPPQASSASAAPSESPTPKKRAIVLATTVEEFHGTAAPGKVAQDFHDATGDELVECHAALQIRESGAQGTVLVRAFIDKDGTTKAVVLVNDTIDDAAFAACVVEAVEDMTLPVADKGTAVFRVDSQATGSAIVGTIGPAD
jgi:hypothetical protein